MGLSNDLSCESGSLLLQLQPPGTLSIRGLRLYFPTLEPWVAQSALLPAVCPVYLCANVGLPGATRCSTCPVLHHSESGTLSLSVSECGAEGSDSGQTACPVCPTLAPVSVPPQPRKSSPPRCPSPPLLPVWMNVYFFISLVSDFLAIRFSVSSGCARRRSVSTYAAILVLTNPFIF